MGYIDFTFVFIYLIPVGGMKTELEKKQNQRMYEDFDPQELAFQ